MAVTSPPQIVNYKASIKIVCKHCVLRIRKSLVKVNDRNKSRNFTVGNIENNDCRLTLFHTGHLNVTKVRQLREIDRLCQLLNELCCDDQPPLQYRVDNITATGSVSPPPFTSSYGAFISHEKLNLQEILKRASDRQETEFDIVRLHYDRENFPGLKIWTIYGTILLFNSGRFVLTGVKDERHLSVLADSIIRELCAK